MTRSQNDEIGLADNATAISDSTPYVQRQQCDERSDGEIVEISSDDEISELPSERRMQLESSRRKKQVKKWQENLLNNSLELSNFTFDFTGST